MNESFFSSEAFCLQQKYNLFSPNHKIQNLHKSKTKKEAQKELKLQFIHPQLLFLTSNSPQNNSMLKNNNQPKVINSIARQIKTAHTYNRSKINYQTTLMIENISNNKSWIKDKERKQSFGEGELKITGLNKSEKQYEALKSRELLKEEMKRYAATSYLKKRKYFADSSNYDSTQRKLKCQSPNIFDVLANLQPSSKLEKWKQNIQKQRHKVKLNIYIDAEKKYLEYMDIGLKANRSK